MRTLKFYTYLSTYMLRKLSVVNKAHRHFENGQIDDSIKIMDDLVKPAMKKILDIAGANVTVSGLENISKEETYLFVGNHQGNMDIPLLYLATPTSMAFVAKKEMKDIPILGKAMQARGCVFLDRDNPRNAIKNINEGIDWLNKGYNLAIFPEGTRSKGPKMGDFKPGGLRMALKSGVKIIPVTIRNSYLLMEKNNGKLAPANVEIIFSKPIETSEYKDAVKLAVDVKSIIEKALNTPV